MPRIQLWPQSTISRTFAIWKICLKCVKLFASSYGHVNLIVVTCLDSAQSSDSDLNHRFRISRTFTSSSSSLIISSVIPPLLGFNGNHNQIPGRSTLCLPFLLWPESACLLCIRSQFWRKSKFIPNVFLFLCGHKPISLQEKKNLLSKRCIVELQGCHCIIAGPRKLVKGWRMHGIVTGAEQYNVVTTSGSGGSTAAIDVQWFCCVAPDN